MAEQTEPTNEQLGRFLAIYAKQFPGLDSLNVGADVLESMLDRNPAYREAAIRHHQRFQNQIDEMLNKMKKGELRCEHIRPNGKKCPNFNEPGSFYCGLHKDEEI